MKAVAITLLILLMSAAIQPCSAYYVWNKSGSDVDGGNYRPGVFGYTASVSQIEHTPSTLNNTTAVAVLDVAGGDSPHPGMTVSALWYNDRLGYDPQVWYLMVFAETGFPATEMQMRLWGQFEDSLPQGKWAVYQLYDAGSHTWGRTEVSPSGGFGSSSVGSMASPWFSYTMDTRKSNDPYTDWGYIFELRPVPEPSALAALGAGLICLPLVRRRRQ